MNFVDILKAKAIPHQSGGRAGEVLLLCPFCASRDRDPKGRLLLGVNTINGKGHCFYCEWSSKSDAENRRLGNELTIPKVLAALGIAETADNYGSDVVVKHEPETKLPEEYELLWPVPTDKLVHQAYSYLRNRGLSDKQITKKKVGVCLSGRYAYRVIFPVLTNGEFSGFVARDFTGRQDKPYLNSVGSKSIYNLRLKRQNMALLFEGVLKCLAAERVLGEDADCLAVLGKSITDEQVELLRGYKRIVLVPDNDGPGLRGTLKMAKKLCDEGFNVGIARLPVKFKDADDAYLAGDIEALRGLMIYAQPYTEQLVSKTRIEAAWDFRAR